MMRAGLIILMVLAIQGCMYRANLVFFNSTESSLEICNLGAKEAECYQVPPGNERIVPLYTISRDAFIYSITQKGSTATYHLGFESAEGLFSNVYCGKLHKNFCDIAVQFNPDNKIYWSGKNSKHPVKNLPVQPAGFPVVPNA
ncbi:hypothetical protein ACJJIR_09865 [Microbulbifer sp. SSSA008]|uniref:hypothetical protein n=1 Tax=Microbulbifer sp. SSSA008 TaxID=3243380 RepID=UPI0040399703